MKKILLIVALFSAVLLAGADIDIISKGRSAYKIVYADKELFPFHNRLSVSTAETLQRILRHATGVNLPIVAESKFDGKSKAIFLGATRSLKENGLAPEVYGRWEHRIDVRKGNIYLHGMDWRNKGNPKAGYRQWYVHGTHKAMLTFLEKFADLVVAGTPNTRDGVPKAEKISIPDNYSFKRTPVIEYNMTSRRTLDYDVANNGFYAPWYGSYGGHNHNVALNPAKYFKSHPEYYAINRGKRNPGPRVQLCLSNKAVQELIYQEVLDHLDRGYDMVQLAQSDGFTPCECVNCQNLYGLKPKVTPEDRQAYRASEVWGEKLWILHRGFAKRLLKDRPGKKVCIIAYGPTRKPPVSFKEFPENVMIELAPYNDEIVNTWKPYKVPGGFVVYLYNWGYYNPEGFMPKRSWKFCQAQVRSMLANNVKGIYCCGFGENHGLEGPTYYIWLKLTEDPDQDVKQLLKRFCKGIFPKAAREMEEFYTLIDSRLQLQYSPAETDWNDPELLNGKLKLNDRIAFGTSLLRWPEDVLQKLEALLKKAESKSGKNWQLSLVRFELEYLTRTARAINAMKQFRITLSDRDYKTLEKSLLHRQDLLDSLKWNKSNQALKDGLPLFAYGPKPAVQAGGRLRGLLFAPFNWDIRWMKEKNVKMAGRTIKANDTTPQYLIPGNYLVDMVDIHKQKTVRLFCRSDKNALKVVFIRTNATYEEMAKTPISVLIGPDSKNMHRFIGRFRKSTPAHYMKDLDNLDNKGMGDHYGNGKSHGSVVVPAPGVKLAPGEISAEMTIPWRYFKKAPAPGDKWLFNATADGQTTGVSTYLIWEHNFEQNTWRNTMDHHGTIQF